MLVGSDGRGSGRDVTRWSEIAELTPHANRSVMLVGFRSTSPRGIRSQIDRPNMIVVPPPESSASPSRTGRCGSSQLFTVMRIRLDARRVHRGGWVGPSGVEQTAHLGRQVEQPTAGRETPAGRRGREWWTLN